MKMTRMEFRKCDDRGFVRSELRRKVGDFQTRLSLKDLKLTERRLSNQRFGERLETFTDRGVSDQTFGQGF